LVDADWRTCVLCVGSPQSVRDLVIDAGLPASVLVAIVNRSELEDLKRTYAVSATPTVLVVDGAGLIQEAIVGPFAYQRLQEIAGGSAITIAVA
jgi:hypothetical protein